MLRPFIFLATVMVVPALAEAQGTARPQLPVVPSHMVPPAGKCRIWMDDVPPAQQPAPTDCQTALRQKPANGTVVFGPTERDLEPSGFRSNPSPPTRRDSTSRARVPGRGRAAPAPQDTTKPSAARRPESAS